MIKLVGADGVESTFTNEESVSVLYESIVAEIECLEAVTQIHRTLLEAKNSIDFILEANVEFSSLVAAINKQTANLMPALTRLKTLKQFKISLEPQYLEVQKATKH